MRDLFLLILLMSVSGLFAQQLPNSDFEQWTDNAHATNWNSINDLIAASGTKGFFRTQDAYAGQYAGVLVSHFEFGMIVPGVLTTGQVEMGSVSGGVPFAFRPDRFSFYYKHPTAGNAQVHLIFTRFTNGNKDTIATASFFPVSNANVYTKADVSIVYHANDVPDSMNVVFLTDMQNAGDTLIVDKLEFDYATAFDEHVKVDDIRIYPNPGSGTFYLSRASESSLEVYDLRGRKVADAQKGADSIDLSGLNVGMYIVKNEDYSLFFKLMIVD